MIKIENVKVDGFEAAIRGMRNPMNSWGWSDSSYCRMPDKKCSVCEWNHMGACYDDYIIGPNDHELMMKLAKAGSVHAKYRRMITVSLDILAPLYWWKEFDTYKVGTVANSCSTMHKIAEKEFVFDDFSCEHLDIRTRSLLEKIISTLNDYRNWYVNYDPNELEIHGCPSKKDIWWQMIQLLPTSYNQRRTVMLNYEVLTDIYHSRKDHKLDEWRKFCEWIQTLPYSEIITVNKEEKRC
jgi:hypothetical protein